MTYRLSLALIVATSFGIMGEAHARGGMGGHPAGDIHGRNLENNQEHFGHHPLGTTDPVRGNYYRGAGVWDGGLVDTSYPLPPGVPYQEDD